MIILNSLNNKGAGFHYDTNKITIIDKQKIKTGKANSILYLNEGIFRITSVANRAK